MVGHTGSMYQEFTIPAGAGTYATEIVYVRQSRTAVQPKSFSQVLELVLLIEALPTSCAIEVDVLKPGGDPDTAADWVIAVGSETTTGLKSPLVFYQAGLRVRAKSGGTAGTAKVITSFLY